jgi:hypothetical protein
MHNPCNSNPLQHFNLPKFEHDTSICIAIKTSNRKTSGKAASSSSVAKDRNVTSACFVSVYVIIKVEEVDSCTNKKVSVHSQQLENKWAKGY